MAYVVTFGKFKGQSIDQLGVGELLNYAGFLVKRAGDEGKPLSKDAYQFTKEVLKFATENLDSAIKTAIEQKAAKPAAESADVPF